MDQNSSLGKKFDLNSESGVSVVLASIRASELSSARKNELRDLVFQYTNRGGDVEVKATLEKMLSAYEVEPVRLKEAFKVQNIVFPFGSARPSPVFKSVNVDQATTPVQQKTEVSKPVDETKIETAKTEEPSTQNAIGASPEVKVDSAPESVPETLPAPDTTPAPAQAPISNQSPAPNTPVNPTTAQTESPAKETASSTPVTSEKSDAQTTSPASVSVSAIPGGDRLERIRQIKQAVNGKVGNPVNLIDIDNNVGREYMASLLDAMKKLNQGNTSEMDKAMQRLEVAYQAVEVAVDKHNDPNKNTAVPSQSPVSSSVPVQVTSQPASQTPAPQPAEQTPSPAPIQQATPVSVNVQAKSEDQGFASNTSIPQATNNSVITPAPATSQNTQTPQPTPAVSNDPITPSTQQSTPEKTEVSEPDPRNINALPPSPASAPATVSTPQTPEPTPSISGATSGLASVNTAQRPTQSVPPTPKPIAGFSNLASSLNNGQNETVSKENGRQPTPETPATQSLSANTPQAQPNTQTYPLANIAEKNTPPLASNSPNLQQNPSVAGASLANNFSPQVPSQTVGQSQVARPVQPEPEHESLVEKATHFAENLASNLGFKPEETKPVEPSSSPLSNPANNTVPNYSSVSQTASPSPSPQSAANAVPNTVRPLSQSKELLTPEDLPKTKQEFTETENIPLYSKEIDFGLEQLLLDWSLFNKSGLFGTGPKGREHPLFKTLAPLQIPVILAGRFEGSSQEVKQSITDYMNGWRYEQGIIYDKDETFETYLRRVIKHILDLQRKQKTT